MDSIIVFVAKYFFILSILITAYVWFRLSRQRQWELAVWGVIGGVIALILMKIAGALYYDPRPFVSQHIKPLFAHAADNGFPSDHTLLTMFLAFCVLAYSRRWGGVLVVIALLVGSARVAAHVHSPIDIIGSIVFAGVAALVARPPANWALQRWTPRNARRSRPHRR
ncbi:MAG: phosphatase PAP2 family protein [Thermoleophilia bacterium]